MNNAKISLLMGFASILAIVLGTALRTAPSSPRAKTGNVRSPRKSMNGDSDIGS